VKSHSCLEMGQVKLERR